MKKLPIVELAVVVQGEGRLAGVPNFMVRMVGCNLFCHWCDSVFASWKPEAGKYDFHDIMDMIEKNPQVKHCFITGGNPSDNPMLLQELLDMFFSCGVHTCIEDNGTQFRELQRLDFVSLSPKLMNSVPEGKYHKRHRLILEEQVPSLQSWIEAYPNNIQLKFVIQTEADIQEALQLARKAKADNSFIYLMPEGKTQAELAPRRQWLIKRCIELGVNYTDRLHVIAFGDVRGV